jgi:hypothetical protein
MKSFDTELRGQLVTVHCDHIQPAEPDVGIMSAYVDSFSVFDSLGEPIDDLAEDELEAIQELADDFLNEDDEPDDLYESILN